VFEIPTGPFERRLRLPPGHFQFGKKALSQGILTIQLRKVR
jgi:hypothetical protein